MTDSEFEARPGFSNHASLEDEEDEEDQEDKEDDENGEDEEGNDDEDDEGSVEDVWKSNGVHHNGLNGIAPAPAPVLHPSKNQTGKSYQGNLMAYVSPCYCVVNGYDEYRNYHPISSS